MILDLIPEYISLETAEIKIRERIYPILLQITPHLVKYNQNFSDKAIKKAVIQVNSLNKIQVQLMQHLCAWFALDVSMEASAANSVPKGAAGSKITAFVWSIQYRYMN